MKTVKVSDSASVIHATCVCVCVCVCVCGCGCVCVTLYISLQYYNSKTGPNFRLLRKLEVNFDIASFRVSCSVSPVEWLQMPFYPLQWINAYTVVAMDTTERIHLLSVKTDSEIEVNQSRS